MQNEDSEALHQHENTHRDIDQHVARANDNDVAEGEKAAPSVSAVGFTCETCQKVYTAKSSLLQHQKATHSKERFSCSVCLKKFGIASNRNRHQRTCQDKSSGSTISATRKGTFACLKCKKRFRCTWSRNRHQKSCNNKNHTCPKCSKRCSTAHGLRRHIKVHNKAPHRQRNERVVKQHRPGVVKPPGRVQNASFRCRRCTKVFNNRHELYLHRVREHFHQPGEALQPHPWGRGELAPWYRDDALRQVYEANSFLILENHRLGPLQSVFNFPITNDVNINKQLRFAEDVYQRQQRAFRLNVVFGMILQNRETGQYRYFIPYNNRAVFERPVHISRRTDLQTLRRQLESTDILTELLRQRPDTKWIPVLVTNVHFVVTETFYPVGQGSLPKYLLRKDSLYPLVKNQQNQKLYNDNLCAFRCVALHRGFDVKSLEGSAKQYFRQWAKESENTFPGVSLEEFPDFEKAFSLNLEVYDLTEDGFARSIYKSRQQFESTMFVNMYNNHLSYIRNFPSYAQKYQCKTCSRHFKQPSDLHRHQKSCTNKTKFVYPGGFYQNRDSIFEKLDQYEIHVPEKDRTFPWFVCYDFEALLLKVQDCSGQALQWTQKHHPVSVSLCSNVEGHTDPVCIVNTDQDQLVRKMILLMNDIAYRVYELAEEKWHWVLEAINQKLDKENDNDTVENSEYEWDEETGDETGDRRESDHPLKRIYDQFDGYMSQVPVLGFNSAKYDLNLIKRCLTKHLNMHKDTNTFVVKKNNAYVCIANQTLKILDMSQFLAPGSSYAGFLKAYNVTEQKGFFPYEWFDDVNKLEATSLPPHDAFHSQLKDVNISKEEYEQCQNVWNKHQMTTFRDFLIWYNNIDVQPFVQAVENFQKFYFEKGIDVFKTAISIPGIARQLLFRTSRTQNANFALFDEQNKDLYQTIKHNIVGGPSIIFTRHHCVGQTQIRNQKPCGAILGFDANALYLQAIGQPMPVGPFVRRLAENDFRPLIRDKYMSAYYWMNWLIHTQRYAIKHKLNTGREVKIDKYRVDGYVPPTQLGQKATVFQYHGCYWHGHLCKVTQSIRNEKWHKTQRQRFHKTRETTAFLKKDHVVIEMWECQFQQYCRQNPGIYDFINTMRPGFFQSHKGKITDDLILQGVDSRQLFGMVEVDIEVPQQWPTYFQHPTLTPYQYFEEMSPLFCTTEIPFDAIGKHMQTHIREHQLSDKPRRLLVGGMKARQIMLATPLLKWYLDHGMVVSKIYQVVEFQQQRCFRDFVREVSDARRQGDVNPDTAIIADTMKVIGNSGYGSLLMDKSKHREIKYIQGENKTCLKVNDPLFQKLECLDLEEQYYEVEMAKRKIKLDLPIQLGYFILQYAKLRMLEFYYEFMDRYVDRSDFEYCEMDTDSAYMAISGSCLKDVIKPEMKDNYLRGLDGFCTDTDIEADTQYHWFPRTCCPKHVNFDKRTPGLFKLEYQGDEMIGLCSKTYIVRKTKVWQLSRERLAAIKVLNKAKGWKPERQRHLQTRYVHEYKLRSKGVSKRHLKAPMTKFRRVLKTQKAESGTNRGFRVRNNTVFTYTQERRGFSYIYCKRKVLDDGIHTEPLDITLCPVPLKERDIDDQELVDLLVHNFED